MKNNHIFTWDGENDKLIMTIWESNFDALKIIGIAIRLLRGISNDVKEYCDQSSELLQTIKPPKINPYRQVELYYKYRLVVPVEYHQKKFYIKLPNNVLRKVKEEKVSPLENRAKVKAVKEERVGATDLKKDAFGVK